jgi:hypothetical protein
MRERNFQNKIGGVLYPGYRGTPVMAQLRNLAQDTPGLPVDAPEGFQYRVGTAGVGSTRSRDIECLAR